jgi:ankyrin repeat protein
LNFVQIKHGSDLWHQDENHLTPLTAAILNERSKYVDLILYSFEVKEEENPDLNLNKEVNPGLSLKSSEHKEENPHLKLNSFGGQEQVNPDLILNSSEDKEVNPDLILNSSEHKEKDIPDQNRSLTRYVNFRAKNRSLKRYVNLRAKNYSPLMIAAAKPVYPIVIRLLECGADPNERSKYGL